MKAPKTQAPAAGRCGRRAFLKAAGAAAAAAGFPALVRAAPRLRRVLALGIDGMDPTLTARFLAEGRLPQAARLREQGVFLPLRTSHPPQSPVAWADFISGANAGTHGIFDFMARDPATLQPYLSTARRLGPARAVTLGRHRIPFSAPRPTNLRQGATLWNELEAHGVPCRVLRMPSNFPPTPSTARTLSGLGTPDVHGSYGVFTFFTTRPDEATRDVPGGRIERVRVRDGVVRCRLLGPSNPFRAEEPPVELPFEVWLDPFSQAARLRLPGQELLLRAGEWSDWVRLRFEPLPLVAGVPAICRFRLRRVRPEFELYVSPLNIDPREPALPISTPPRYARELADAIGPFYTQGLPQDTRALSEGVFDDDEYRELALFCLEEERRLFRRELAAFREGFFFSYFGSLDLNSHMFWRAIDPGHPLYSPELARRQGGFLPWLYEQMDGVIGEALQTADERTALLVVSDHGFGSFRRQFHLNSWLMDQGYAAARDPRTRGETAYYGDLDWDATRAYGFGINSLYLNLRGREAQGCVAPGAPARALTEELAERLLAVRDPATGDPVIRRVYRPEEIYAGPCLPRAPDLVIGYHAPYRASWDTVLGKFPRGPAVVDNRDKWSGDHTLDAALMSGVLFCNRRLSAEHPALSDMAPTILRFFEAPIPEAMTGRAAG